MRLRAPMLVLILQALAESMQVQWVAPVVLALEARAGVPDARVWRSRSSAPVARQKKLRLMR